MHIIYYLMKNICFLLMALAITDKAFSQTVTDVDIKKNVTPIKGSIQRIALLNPTTFEYNTEKYRHLALERGVKFGFNAEEIQQVFPEIVKQTKVSYMFGKNSYRDTRIKTIDQNSLIPVLVSAIQEQQEQIQQLKLEVEMLKNKTQSESR